MADDIRPDETELGNTKPDGAELGGAVEPTSRPPRRQPRFRGHYVVDDEPTPVFDAPPDPQPAPPAAPPTAADGQTWQN